MCGNNETKQVIVLYKITNDEDSKDGLYNAFRIPIAKGSNELTLATIKDKCTALRHLNHCLGPEGFHWRLCVGKSSRPRFCWMDITNDDAKLPVKEYSLSQLESMFMPPTKQVADTTSMTAALKGLGKAMSAVTGSVVEGINNNNNHHHYYDDDHPRVPAIAFKLLDLVKMTDNFMSKRGRRRRRRGTKRSSRFSNDPITASSKAQTPSVPIFHPPPTEKPPTVSPSPPPQPNDGPTDHNAPPTTTTEFNSEIWKDIKVVPTSVSSSSLDDDQVFNDGDDDKSVVEKENDAANEEILDEETRNSLEIKIKTWSEEHGKKKNLRTLLSSLDQILWSDTKWKPMGLGDLLDNKQVKRAYYKASRIVHPDKTVRLGPKEQFLAQRIFDALCQAKIIFDNASIN